MFLRNYYQLYYCSSFIGSWHLADGCRHVPDFTPSIHTCKQDASVITWWRWLTSKSLDPRLCMFKSHYSSFTYPAGLHKVCGFTWVPCQKYCLGLPPSIIAGESPYVRSCWCDFKHHKQTKLKMIHSVSTCLGKSGSLRFQNISQFYVKTSNQWKIRKFEIHDHWNFSAIIRSIEVIGKGERWAFWIRETVWGFWIATLVDTRRLVSECFVNFQTTGRISWSIYRWPVRRPERRSSRRNSSTLSLKLTGWLTWKSSSPDPTMPILHR